MEGCSVCVCEREKPFEERFFPSRALPFPNLFEWPRARRKERLGLGMDKKKDLFLGCPLLQGGKGQKKNPGVELLSRTLLCSTIVARPLIDRVRDGNVSFKPAMNTGKKYEMKKGIGGGSVTGVQLSS